MTSSFRRDTVSSGKYSSLSMPQNQEKKQIPRYEVRFTNKKPSIYHIESICQKISKSIGIIAKIRHYVPRRILLSVYNSLIVPYLTYGICCWGNCALTQQRKIVTLQKRALRLIYFSKSKEHAVKFSRTDKMYAFFTRIGAQIWNSIPYSIKILKRSSFRKRIKELLLNFLRSEDDYVEVSRLINKLFNTLG